MHFRKAMDITDGTPLAPKTTPKDFETMDQDSQDPGPSPLLLEPVTLKTRNQLNSQRREKIQKVKKRIDNIIETLTTEEIEQITDIISADTLSYTKDSYPKKWGKGR